jgi:hypothetical protein
MKLHTDKLTDDDVYTACGMAGPDVDAEVTEAGSRIRDHALIVYLSGTSPRASAHDSHDSAATWDEWGMVLAELFAGDPDMTIPKVYDDAEHFRWSTGNRFDTLTPAYQHPRHRWEYSGESVTGSYHVHTCDCGALRRYLSNGVSWSEFSRSLSS